MAINLDISRVGKQEEQDLMQQAAELAREKGWTFPERTLGTRTTAAEIGKGTVAATGETIAGLAQAVVTAVGSLFAVARLDGERKGAT